MRKAMLFGVAVVFAVAVTEASGDEKSMMPPDHGVFAPGDIKWA